MEHDDQHFLYQHYLDVLADLKPDFLVLENVPGLLSARAHGSEIFRKMLLDFSRWWSRPMRLRRVMSNYGVIRAGIYWTALVSGCDSVAGVCC